MVPSPGIRPFLPFALGDQKKKKRETEKRIVRGKNRKKDFQVDIKCHVYHLNRPASGNGDTGGGWAPHSQRMMDPSGTRAGVVGFSDRKQVGQLI